MNCPFCNKLCKSARSLQQHSLRCKSNSNAITVKPSYGMLGKKGANQFTKSTDYKVSEATKKKLSEASKAQVWTVERRAKLSEAMKKAVLRNPESYSSSNRGRTKQIIIDNIKLQGQWEVDFYLWAKSNGLAPIRPKEAFQYEWNGTRWYHPDFYIKKLDLYVEVKGYETDRDKAKWAAFPKKLCIIKEKEIKQIRKGCFGGL